MYSIPLPKEGEKFYTIRDLGLAATLLNLKFSMLDMSIQLEGIKGQPIGYFRFENTPELSKAVQMYINEEIRVEPKSLLSDMRTLKAQAVNAGKNPFASVPEHTINPNY